MAQLKTPQIKTIYIFRHGETDWNKDRRLQGHTDIPLNAKGRSQALVLKEFFSAHPIDAMLTSDLKRARETAELAINSLNVPLIVEPRLRETNLGDAEGLTQTEVAAQFGKEIWEGWCSLSPDFHHFRFPNGETKSELLRRVTSALEEFLSSSAHQKIGVATHGGVVRRMIHHARPDLPSPVMVGNCVIYEITYNVATTTWDLKGI
jgi:broad specificity phosphatase PhoE